jgi:hypothetical protein
MTKLLERGLPKWPQMLVSGTPIKPEQALEIIRRTDEFFRHPSGNDQYFVDTWRKKFGMPAELPYSRASKMPDKEWWALIDKQRKEMAAWQKEWGVMDDPQYVTNTWLSSCYIGGPYGWCWPDGTILFRENVGKWPSVEDVLADWSDIAKTFPFLELGVDLRSAENCEENESVVGFLVKGGAVEVVDSQKMNPLNGFPALPSDSSLEAQLDARIASGFNPASEHGISDEVLEKWAERSA